VPSPFPSGCRRATAAEFTHRYDRASAANRDAIVKNQDASNWPWPTAMQASPTTSSTTSAPTHPDTFAWSAVLQWVVARLIAAWQVLKDGLATRGRLELTERLRGIALMGQRPEAVFVDPAVTHWNGAFFSATYGNKDVADEPIREVLSPKPTGPCPWTSTSGGSAS